MSLLKSPTLRTRVKGDTFPFKFKLRDASGTPEDITGYTFTFTVDPNENPSSTATNLFTITGAAVDAAGGVFQFIPSQPQADQLVPRTNDVPYHYWCRVTDAAGRTRTGKGKLPVTGGSGG